MTLVNIIGVKILNNPCKFFDDFHFEITFEVLAHLQGDLEFKVVYVGSAENSDRDQILQTAIVGPVSVGVNEITLRANCPDPSLIPQSDALGVTVVLLQCSYKGREFVRVGYYVNNDYHTPELCENPQLPTDFSLLVRSILAEEPRITRFAIPWDDEENADFIPDDEIDADRMDVSGDEEDAEDAENEEGVVVEDGSGLAENDFDENDEDDEEDDDDDIENVEHDLEEDEEKFKQKRHGVVNSSVDNLAAVFTPTQVS